MDPWSKVTASRASDGVIDRAMTSAERMKLHRRRLGLRPVQVIVSQLDIDCARGAPTRFQENLHVEGPSPCNLIEFLKNGDGCGFNPTDFERLLGGAEIHPWHIGRNDKYADFAPDIMSTISVKTTARLTIF